MNNRIPQLIHEIKLNLNNNNLTSAHFRIKKLLKSEPENIDGIFLRAQLNFLEKNYVKAITNFDKCLKVFPGNTDILRRKLYSFMKLNDFKNARLNILEISSKQQLNAELLFLLGTCHIQLGDSHKAIEVLEKAISLPEHNPIVEITLGNAFKSESNIDKAEQYYRSYINKISQKGIGYWSLADLKSKVLNSSDREKMLGLTKKSANNQERSLLHFALGQSFEESKEYQKAFSHWKSANSIQNEIRPFLHKPFQALVNNIKLSESNDFRREITTSLKKQRQPIFIVGMPRSGSTLVEQILTANSDISATDELPFFEKIAATFERHAGVSQNVKKLTEDEITKISSDYLKSVEHYQDSHKTYFVDKNPNNFLYLGVIKKIFPDAKIINILRNPVDNAISVYRQYFYKGHDFSFSLDSIIQYWQGYLEVMQHWNSLFHDQIYHLRYENLINDFDDEISQLMDYLQIEFQPQMSEFYKNKRVVLTPSVSQVTKPLYNTSIGYYDNFKDELTEYITQFEDLVNKIKFLFR